MSRSADWARSIAAFDGALKLLPYAPLEPVDVPPRIVLPIELFIFILPPVPIPIPIEVGPAVVAGFLLNDDKKSLTSTSTGADDGIVDIDDDIEEFVALL